MENENYDKSFDSDEAPYLSKNLPAPGAKLPNYYATGHLSLDNYISLISGQGPNVLTQADCLVFVNVFPGTIGVDGQAAGAGCVYPSAVKTIANQLEAKGLTWKGYMEDMANAPAGQTKSCRHPAINASDPTQSAKRGDQYAARHNPFVYFHSIIDSPSCAANDVDYSQFARDLDARPRPRPATRLSRPTSATTGTTSPASTAAPAACTRSTSG